MSDTQPIPRRTFLGQVQMLALGALGTTVRAATAIPESNKAEGMTPSPASDAPLYSREFNAFRNRTLEQRVRELTDREEIRELIARYAHRVAHGESNADLFTDDGVFIVRIPGRPVQETSGREKINKMYKEAVNPPGHSLPMIHNYLISISDDEATGLCSNELRTTENGRSIIASGYYEDRYRRDNGRWRFAVRDASFFHWTPIQDGWTELKK
jgi:SnoaL-like domain